MRRKWFALACLALVWASPALAANPVILLTGYWPPTNEMLREFSQDPRTNPGGWKGENWQGSGFDVIAYFPEFVGGDQIGTGPFRVDFAAAYNDFFTYTEKHTPIAILSFGQGAGPWEIETRFPAFFTEMFRTGELPSRVGERRAWPVPESLRRPQPRRSSLPGERIAQRVNALRAPGLRAWVDQQGDAGDFLCGFIGYLGAWYHEEHSDRRDPRANLASGFIHVGADVKEGRRAVHATLEAMVEYLRESLR